MAENAASTNAASTPASGPAAATLLAAAIGCASLGICALAGDASHALGRMLSFWRPTGPLSGVTDTAIVIWLLTWLVLSRLWAHREINLRRVNRLATVLFIAGLLLTFPPFMDLLQGK